MTLSLSLTLMISATVYFIIFFPLQYLMCHNIIICQFISQAHSVCILSQSIIVCYYYLSLIHKTILLL